MRIEVKPTRSGKFVWNFVANNGKTTGNNETFPTRGNATRAAKAVVTSIVRPLGVPIVFRSKREGDVTFIAYAADPQAF